MLRDELVAVSGVADGLLGRAHHGLGLGGAPEPAEEVRRPGERDERALVVVDDGLLRDAQDVLRLVVAAQHVERLAQDVPDRGRRVRLPGRAREPLGEPEVEREPGLVRALEHEVVTAGAAAVEAPDRDPQRVLPPVRPAGLDQVRERAADLLAPAGRQTGADDLRVEGVRDPDLLPAPLGHDLEQATPLEVVDRLRGRELAQVGEAHRFPDAHDLERVALRVGERAEPEPDHFPEPGRRREGTAEPPQATGLLQRARVACTHDELAEEEGVPAARRPERAERATVDLAAEHLGHEPGRVLERQLRDVDADEQLVLPQRGHGFGRGFAGADGDDREDLRRGGEEVEQGRRGVVELVGVVDQQHQAPTTGGFDDRRGRPPERLGATVGCRARDRQQRREHPERDRRRAAVRADLRRGPAAGFGEREALRGQPRLADAGRPREEHAAGIVVHESADRGELGFAPHQRPRRSSGHVITSLARGNPATGL